MVPSSVIALDEPTEAEPEPDPDAVKYANAVPARPTARAAVRPTATSPRFVLKTFFMMLLGLSE
jgi:hypothetical protein